MSPRLEIFLKPSYSEQQVSRSAPKVTGLTFFAIFHTVTRDTTLLHLVFIQI
jgi:hypothetical protein